MRSLKFPQMFSTNSTRVWASDEYNRSTVQNTILLLQCKKGELLGDPYFGLIIEQYLFNQNNYILKDAIIDIIYTQLALFIPQIAIKRQDIKLFAAPEKGKVYCTFTGINQIDYTLNTYNLLLFQSQDIN